jgi:hypothetical protein
MALVIFYAEGQRKGITLIIDATSNNKSITSGDKQS